MALVKLSSCWNTVDAEIIKGALDTARIACMLQSTLSAGDMGLGIAAFEIPILVREEDLEEAKKVIEID